MWGVLMRLLTVDDVDRILRSEHKKHFYSKIYGKQIYPVVMGKLDFRVGRKYSGYRRVFLNNSWYGMVR